MLELGLESGLKHSGVFVFKPERYILELNGTQHMSVPIIDNGKVLISKEYFSYLLEIANDKLEKNKQMRNKFEKLVKEYIYE
jgi:tRNA(Phe) wybutosine-synthesizing methylase Tyw3